MRGRMMELHGCRLVFSSAACTGSIMIVPRAGTDVTNRTEALLELNDFRPG